MPKRRHQDQQAEPEEPEASDEAFGTKRYWDSHYAKYATQQAADDTDEWYLAYTGGLDEILSGAMSRGRDSAVLDIGCGTSRMLRDMRESGHVGELVGCDFSGVELARRCNAGLDIAIKEADCRSCAAVLGRDAFDLILDKGTVDALLCDEDEGEENVRRECGQVREMLRVGGTFCLVTPKYPEEEEEDEGAFEAGDVDGFAGWLQAAIAGLSGRATLHEAGGAGSAAPEGYRWVLDVHMSSADIPNVYLFRKLRHSPRRGGGGEAGAAEEMEIRVHEHDADDDDEDSKEDEDQ